MIHELGASPTVTAVIVMSSTIVVLIAMIWIVESVQFRKLNRYLALPGLTLLVHIFIYTLVYAARTLGFIEMDTFYVSLWNSVLRVQTAVTLVTVYCFRYGVTNGLQ